MASRVSRPQRQTPPQNLAPRRRSEARLGAQAPLIGIRFLPRRGRARARALYLTRRGSSDRQTVEKFSSLGAASFSARAGDITGQFLNLMCR